ncbi:MAG: rRNA maturation RNase YbeY [Candidatus Izemoplasmatales bacterium]|jgi:probable rRNA maturation factor|nr:rRNA maturation RNase YbeY [Candidatus Izemoplasmatales bacterium]NLF49277.1 rRNA maturation RNase YbeY [Acholeplasmataceae bacterium]MDD4354797.1 rRNA maturation RNase YbeY [Candidatus Izemoplasmatales bacterium]MDD4987662.1 rRNA maturation RNase YbeY [Candidatus Izemoplasmatales bacterium]MDD5601369.1 rRNA maturation RNase YbeY [Candidatus Izemoplasmatales bacterium]
MPKINIHYQTEVDVTLGKTIRKALRTAFMLTKPKSKRIINIILLTDEAIRDLNATYRHVDRPTDVLSFPNTDLNPELGDVFISIDRAKEQAKTYQHSLERELAFLAVHGFLHCLGYDHIDVAEEKAMLLRQEEILNKAKFTR